MAPVAQATRLSRRTTRPTEWEIASGSTYALSNRGPFPIPLGESPNGAGESPALPMLKSSVMIVRFWLYTFKR